MFKKAYENGVGIGFEEAENAKDEVEEVVDQLTVSYDLLEGFGKGSFVAHDTHEVNGFYNNLQKKNIRNHFIKPKTIL